MSKRFLMISGDRSIAQGKKGAFYYNLQEYAQYWDRIDIITPRTHQTTKELFGNVFIHVSPWPLLLQPLFIRMCGAGLNRKHGFDIITVHEYAPFYNGLGAYLLYRLIGVPYVLEFHHIVGLPKAATFKESLYLLMTRIFIRLDARRALAIRATSNFSRDIIRRMGVAEQKIKVIPSFYIDTDIFQPEQREKIYDIVSSGRLAENKGFDLLIKAVAIIKRARPTVKAVIVGEGPLKHSLKQLIGRLSLEQNIILAGWQETSQDIAKIYNESRVFVLNSYNEGGPRVTLEAMACNVPVISTPVGLMSDLIKDGENGFIIDWEPSHIAQKIEQLLANSELQQRFASGASERTMPYAKEATARNYALAYQAMIIPPTPGDRQCQT